MPGGHHPAYRPCRRAGRASGAPGGKRPRPRVRGWPHGHAHESWLVRRPRERPAAAVLRRRGLEQAHDAALDAALRRPTSQAGQQQFPGQGHPPQYPGQGAAQGQAPGQSPEQPPGQASAQAPVQPPATRLGGRHRPRRSRASRTRSSRAPSSRPGGTPRPTRACSGWRPPLTASRWRASGSASGPSSSTGMHPDRPRRHPGLLLPGAGVLRLLRPGLDDDERRRGWRASGLHRPDGQHRLHPAALLHGRSPSWCSWSPTSTSS